MENSLVVVSRQWHEPFIRVDVTQAGIGITMTMDDFITALGIEVQQNLHAAAAKVIAGMKRETSHVI